MEQVKKQRERDELLSIASEQDRKKLEQQSLQIHELAEEIANKQKEAESIERETKLKEKLNIERDKEMRK